VGESELLFKKILIENTILCVLSSILIEKFQDSLLRHSFKCCSHCGTFFNYEFLKT